MNDWVVIGVLGFAGLSALTFFATGAGRKAQYPAAENSASPTTPGDGWRITGIFLGIAGIIGLLLSLSMDTTITTDVADFAPSSVVNLDMMHQQGTVFSLSLFAIGAGIFCFAVAAILRAIHSRSA